MNDTAFWLWFLVAFSGLVLSAVCSGLETGLYTINRVRLAVRAGQRRRRRPGLARRSMPLCMSNMYSKLVETHHLKHKARNQLGLFLKGIGLTVEESYAVWRGNFIKDPAMTAEKWQKEVGAAQPRRAQPKAWRLSATDASP